jgi:hypothetical protein
MLEEIIPVLKSQRRPKILIAEQKITAELPEIETKISFLPFINYLKEKRSEASESRSNFYYYLIRKFEAEPLLLKSIMDMHSLDEHADLLELLSTSLFPVVSEHDAISFALAVPYQFQVFYYSDRFRKLFLDDKEEHLLLPTGLSPEQLKTIHCSMFYDHVLEQFYGIRLNEKPELIYQVVDSETRMHRYFRISYDRRFINIRLKGELPSLKDCAVCMNTFRILDLEKQLKTMPLDLFELEGFAVWVAEDVTTIESIETIKKILLRQDDCDTGTINDLKKAIYALVGLNEVNVGLMPFVKLNNQFVLDQECIQHSLVGKNWSTENEDDIGSYRAFINFLSEHPEPVAISVVNEGMLEFAPFLRDLYERGTRSFIGYPLQNSDGLLGALQLTSPVEYQLNFDVLSRLEPAMPLISVVLLKHRDKFHDKIEKLIKEKFTALHQSVEWKFAKVAWDYLRNNHDRTNTGNVGFENVYPLYGAIDIRNSSLERNQSIQKDLKEQLILIDDTLDDLQRIMQLPILEGLKFKTQSIQKSIQDTMMAEDEIRIHEFFENEVETVFRHLQKSNKETRVIMDNYFTILNDSNSRLHRYRCDYEETLATINDTVVRYLEQEEESIQNSYPHYFEKYRTDGVEYNIYIGQSIAPDRPFDVLYLKNMRLWQIRSMAEVARITFKLLPHLKLPLQTTQLIFIHSQCISINFRRDERRFDVEGAYNIRYEIIKKRLDKVRIKDTNERLTQPGKISMVYSNQKEMQEYQQYIEFLQSKNFLKPGIEFLELEDLQGVKGLKAIRVDVNLEEG